MAAPLLVDKGGLVLVATGDMPLLTSQTFSRLVENQRRHSGPVSMLTVVMDDPHGFGRVVRASDGSVVEIIEEAQASPEVLKIKELNASVYCFEAAWLWNALSQVKLSPKGEYYLTDLVGIAVSAGLSVQALVVEDSAKPWGSTPGYTWLKRRLFYAAALTRTGCWRGFHWSIRLQPGLNQTCALALKRLFIRAACCVAAHK